MIYSSHPINLGWPLRFILWPFRGDLTPTLATTRLIMSYILICQSQGPFFCRINAFWCNFLLILLPSLPWTVSSRWRCGGQLHKVGQSSIDAPETPWLSVIDQPLSDSLSVTLHHVPLPSSLLTMLKDISRAVFAGLLLLIKIWSTSSSSGWRLRPRGTREQRRALEARPDLTFRFPRLSSDISKHTLEASQADSC